MRRNAATKLFTLLLAFLLMVTAIPTGNLTTLAAAQKPGAVTKIKKVEVNPTTVTVTYNKAKYAKGYQVRTYKGKKLVKSIKTKNTSCTVKGLSAETKYTIKVRAYNGSKYGKEKSLTLKTETKNLAVTGLKVSSVTKESIKVKYNKAKNAKGYQTRVYKGSKRVAEVKTKNTSCTIDKLSAGTEYTVKIRAYKGKKYGKEKSIAVRTSKEEPDSGDQAEDDTPGIVMPGESTSTGDALVAEYNAYIAYAGEIWKNYPIPNPTGDETHDTPWTVPLGHMGAGIRYDANYTDKYSLFKYNAGTPDAEIDMTLDILHAAGVPAEKYINLASDIVRFELNGLNPDNPMYDYIKENFPDSFAEPGDPDYIDPITSRGLIVTYPSGMREAHIIRNNDFSKGGLSFNFTQFEKNYETWEIVIHCPCCGKESVSTLTGLYVYPSLEKTGTFTVKTELSYVPHQDCVSSKFNGKSIYLEKTFTEAQMMASHRLELTAADEKERPW